MNNIYKNKIDCCGCGTCALVCPKSIIEMTADEEGFLYPHITNPDECIGCSKCEKNCPEINRVREPQKTINYYSGYACCEEVIKKSASGGFATALSKVFIESGGIVYGVKYTNNCYNITYTRASSVEEVDSFRGSKYAQSEKGNIFNAIKDDLTKGNKVLFIGLPCDVSALYNYTRNNCANLFTMELVCHGVTSPLVHREYVENLSKGQSSPIKFFSVRYKKDAWKPYYINAVFENGFELVTPFRPTEYGVAFHYLKRPSCNVCRFKIYDENYGLPADVTIGDNHGVRQQSPSYHHWGSSVILTHTDKGEALIQMIASSFKLVNETESIVSNNLALYKPFPKKKEREQFVRVLRNKGLKATKNILNIRIKDFKIYLRKYIGKQHVFLIETINKIKRNGK